MSTSKKNTTKKNLLKISGLWLPLELLLFLIIGVLLATSWYKYQINPDGTSYISIAYKYSHFQLRSAINGYWGPLYSILIAPLLWFNIQPVIAAKIVGVLAGVAVLYLVYYLLTRELGLQKKIANLFLLGLAPSLLVWIMPGPVTPDVLMVASLLLEVILLLKLLKNPTSWRNIWLFAVSALILYITKYVGFYIVVSQIFAICFIKALAQHDLDFWVRAWVKTMLAFVIVISPVVLALSIKYHHATVSTAGTYNHGILAPQYNLQPIHPMVFQGPFTPPNNTAYSVWEDPTNLPVPHWSLFKNSGYVTKLVYHNINIARDAITSYGAAVAISFVILVSYLLLGLRRAEDLSLVIGLTALIAIAAYLSLTTEPRYLWTTAPLSLAGLGLLLRSYKINGGLIYATSALLIAANVWGSAQALKGSKGVGADIHTQAVAIAKYVPAHSKTTSDTFASIYTCMYDDLQCYGLIVPNGEVRHDQQLYKQLKTEGVKYYIDFGSAQSVVLSFLDQYAHKSVSIAPNVTIYQYN